MDLSQREKAILDTLRQLEREFVLIGGYAVNAYTLPRFSIDCDLVLKAVGKLPQQLQQMGYQKEAQESHNAYHGRFLRYEKQLPSGAKVSVDLLIKEIIDRQTKTIFPASWVFEHSRRRWLSGKTISDRIRLPIINPEALVVMKAISCRSTDIRDVFMLLPLLKDRQWVKKEISKFHDFSSRWKKITEKVTAADFKDNLQGVFGFVDEQVFEKHKKAVLELGKEI